MNYSDYIFEVNSTYSGNRTSLVIQRITDGHFKEVHLILNYQLQSNIGKKINKTIKKLDALPLDKKRVQYIKTKEYFNKKSNKNNIRLQPTKNALHDLMLLEGLVGKKNIEKELDAQNQRSSWVIKKGLIKID